MSPTIRQHVVPRRSPNNFSRKSWHTANKFTQLGSISGGTITLGLGIAVIVAVASLSFFYLGQVLDTATQGDSVQDLEKRMVELKEKQDELELESAQLRSMQALEGQVEQLNLVTTDEVSYLTLPADRVAALAQP